MLNQNIYVNFYKSQPFTKLKCKICCWELAAKWFVQTRIADVFNCVTIMFHCMLLKQVSLDHSAAVFHPFIGNCHFPWICHFGKSGFERISVYMENGILMLISCTCLHACQCLWQTGVVLDTYGYRVISWTVVTLVRD